MNVMSYAKRLTALLLCAVLLLGLMPVGAFAAENEGETTAPTGETTTPTGETTDPADTQSEGDPMPAAEGDIVTESGNAVVEESSYEAAGWKLTSDLTANGTYLIVNRNTVGSGYALLNNNGSVGAVAVTVENNGTDTFIRLDNSAAVWTATGSDTSWAFANGTSYLSNAQTGSDNQIFYTYYSHGPALSATAYNWTVSGNSVYANLLYSVGNISGNTANDDFYLTGGSSWSMSTNSANVYFYTPATVTVVEPGHEYSTVGADVTDAVALSGQTVTLSSVLYDDPTNGDKTDITAASGLTPTYEVVTTKGNPAVISGIENGVATLSGTEGTAVVKVTYTSGDLVAWDEFLVTAKVPVFALSVTEESATLKLGATQTMTAVRLMNNNPTTMGNAVVWSSSDETIATVDKESGLVTAVAEGNATITASWTDPLGNTRTDTVAVSVVDAIYTLDINEGSAHVETAVTAGNTLQLTATLTIDGATIEEPNLHWTVDNAAVATVDSATGLVTFTGAEGRVIVTVTYTAGSKKITDTFMITARKADHVLPNDGTNDFPEYPNEGAIRIDKNASAVGNFSQTGIALVELSMTGVPYTAGSEVDVVIMVDMSGSMNSSSNDMKVDRVTPAKEATRAAVAALVLNEDGTLNNNRVAVYTFQGSSTVTERHGLEAFTQSTLTSLIGTDTDNDGVYEGGSIANWSASDGTPYDKALEKCQTVLEAAKTDGTGDNRKQFVIFVTDGAPSTAFYYVKEDGTKGTVASDVGSGDEEDVAYYKLDTYTEWYSYQMKKAGVDVYSLGIQISESSCPVSIGILRGIAGTMDENGNVVNAKKDANGNETAYGKYFQSVGTNIEDLTDVFLSIVRQIKQAATNVTVTDKITDEYVMILNTPANVTLPEGTELTIDVKQYTLDANKNRTGDPVIIESVSVNDTDKVTLDADGNIVSINADTFSYDASTHIITWKADKLDSTELALSYYLYLEESAGYDPEDQTDPGAYATNEYATIDYTNHLDHQCRKEFPVPQLTWNGAQVSYTFYLVNSQGQPVNRAGRVVPFAEAIYVTEVVTESIIWDTDDDKLLNAEYIAQEYLPDVYSLYDPNTAYTINVYEDENGVDKNNYFDIAADKLFADGTSTTKVFNTKTGTIYSAPGHYTSANASGFDFATTTVAFAVVWNPALAEDTMVVDFGLDVVIDVATNDSLDTEVVGLRTAQPNANINVGQITPTNTKSIDIMIDGVKVATAEVENQTSIRFVLDKENGMLFNKAVTFYYESKVEYYQNDVLQTSYMYSSVTVIPATTIYYEDSYVTLTTFNGTTVENEDGTTTTTYTATPGWEVVGTAANGTQAQDRPGKSQISAAIDADNNYGYDKAYAEMSEYSMGSAVVANVKSGKYATAEFEFYGTGFDVISLTDKTTGTIVVEVLNADGERVLKESVNTYFGYKLVDGNWVATESGDVNALYQVPVIKIGDGKTTEKLDYGKYKVIITATYVPILDSNKSDEGYKFYLDAIRVYNPTGNQDNTSNDAYIQDGEAYPEYFELRDKIIEKGAFDALTTDSLEGVVFIDGNTAEKNVTNYTSYGPNNEVYLAAGQAVSFELSATGPVAKVQIALKSVGGSASVKIYSADGVTALDADLETATDMYYDITSMNGKTVVITNDGDGILSITNVKVTYTANPNGTAATKFMVRRASVNAALDTMNVVEPEVPETTVPETTVPETEVPETTVPEETEPETTEPEQTEPETTEPEETEPETEAPTEKPTEPNPEEIIKKTVGKIIKKIFGWLFG